MARYLGWLLVILAVLSSPSLEAQVCSCGHPCDVPLVSTLSGIEVVEACLSITTGGDCHVEFPAWVTLRAGESILLTSGFWVDADAELVLEIEASLSCDPAVDADSDLFDACLDCDDGDGTVYPGADEECNGTDDDCDHAIDNDVSCDDSLACTEDVCLGAAGCDHGVLPDSCLIESQCHAAGTYFSGNPCWVCDPAQSTTDWTPNDGATCDDGNSCTTGDVCDAGSCSGSLYSCDDSLTCTQDTCLGDGTCDHALQPTSCLIEGVCHPAGGQRPGDPCWVCDPAQSTTGWTPNGGAACDDGESCTTGDVCNAAGSCFGSPIVDAYESNDFLAEAHDLGSIQSDDSWPAGTFSASLYPTGDVDWFEYYVEDQLAVQQPGPRITLSSIPVGTNYQLCAYYDCDEEPTSTDCVLGASSTHGGLPGCCSTNSGTQSEEVRFTPACGDGPFPVDDSGTTYVQVYRASGTWICGQYVVNWGGD